MPSRSLRHGSSVLFDIDENHETRRVSIQPAPSAMFEISQDDPVLGDDVVFHRQSSTANNASRQRHGSTYRTRNRSRSRRHSVTPWPICGLTMPVLALRILTAALVMPLVVAGLVWAPQPSIVALCVLLACGCLYEYSWLAFRIHYQLLSTYTYYERPASEEETDQSMHYHFQSIVSEFSNSVISDSTMTGQFSMQQGDGAFGGTDTLGDDEEEDHTIGGEGGMAARAAKMVASPLDMLEFAIIATAVSPLAETWCGGREWLAKLMLTAVFTPLWVLAMHYLMLGANFPVALGDLPGSVVFDTPQLTWIAVVLACYLALSAPNMRFAASMLIQLNAFFAIALNSLACPILSIHKCTQPLLSATEVFGLGAVLLLMLRGLTSTSPADMVIVTSVDLLGYLFVVGGFSLLVGAVDVHNDRAGMFARVLVLLVVVLWTAQIAGYVCDRLISHFQLRRVRILPRRIAVRLDLEPSLCAICVGALATAVGGSLVALPTPLYVNVIFAFVAIMLARLGALFMSLLRRAAGVKRSSRALPGFGGMLDMTSSILFAAIVFSRLYTVVTVEVALAAAAAAHGNATSSLSVDFNGLSSHR